MGFDYLYLGQRVYFIIIFSVFILIVASQIVYLLLSYKLKEMHEVTKNEYNEKNYYFNRNNFGLK